MYVIDREIAGRANVELSENELYGESIAENQRPIFTRVATNVSCVSRLVIIFDVRNIGRHP